ncbi:MAG: hypothetical protein II922_05175 [Succinimonas sp.]|nr:hypothetical protein [Succinimonas sp.]
MVAEAALTLSAFRCCLRRRKLMAMVRNAAAHTGGIYDTAEIFKNR